VPFATVREDIGSEEFHVQTREHSNSGPWLAKVSTTLPGLTVTGGLVDTQPFGDVSSRLYRYRADLKRPVKAGDFAGEILFFTGDGTSTPVHRIPVRGTVHSPVYSVPKSLYATMDPVTQDVRLLVTIVSDDPHFKLDAKPTAGNLKSLSVQERGRTVSTLTFEVAPRLKLLEPVSTTLEFDTNHPTVPRIRVPLTLVAHGE